MFAALYDIKKKKKNTKYTKVVNILYVSRAVICI